MSKPDDEQYEYTCMLLTGGRTIGIINGESYPPVKNEQEDESRNESQPEPAKPDE